MRVDLLKEGSMGDDWPSIIICLCQAKRTLLHLQKKKGQCQGIERTEDGLKHFYIYIYEIYMFCIETKSLYAPRRTSFRELCKILPAQWGLQQWKWAFRYLLWHLGRRCYRKGWKFLSGPSVPPRLCIVIWRKITIIGLQRKTSTQLSPLPVRTELELLCPEGLPVRTAKATQYSCEHNQLRLGLSSFKVNELLRITKPLTGSFSYLPILFTQNSSRPAPDFQKKQSLFSHSKYIFIFLIHDLPISAVCFVNWNRIN